MGISRKSLLKDVMKVPEAVEVLDELLPGFTTNPQTQLCNDMRMTIIMNFPEMGLTDERREEILSALDEVGEE